jgi:hypothetical protein
MEQDIHLLLLDEYKKYLKNFNDPKMKKKAIWGKISQTLKGKGFDIDGVKCERKLIHKKSKYKSTKIHNKQTGNNPKTCSCYQELDDIFGNSPAISALATCLNLKGIIIEENKSKKNHESPERKENKNANKIKTEDKVFKALNDFSKELQKKENERMDRIKEMHNDQMTATNLFINVFEKFMKNGD